MFNQFMSATYVVGVVIASVFFAAVGKLVEIWISPEYVLSTVAILFFTIYIWQECIGRTILTMIEATGKYKETKKIEIVTSVLTLVLSFVFGYLWGIVGVVIAPVLVIMFIRQPLETKFVYNKIFKTSMKKEFIRFIIYTVIMLAICYLNFNLINWLGLYAEATYFNWIISSGILAIIVAIIIGVPALLLDKSFRGAAKRILAKGINRKAK